MLKRQRSEVLFCLRDSTNSKPIIAFNFVLLLKPQLGVLLFTETFCVRRPWITPASARHFPLPNFRIFTGVHNAFNQCFSSGAVNAFERTRCVNLEGNGDKMRLKNALVEPTPFVISRGKVLAVRCL